MADIISRLKLESGEFDSKIKRAGQELLAYSEHCRKAGLQMGYANNDAKEFAKALGSMQTVSQTARGKINELSEVFVNAKVMYKNMTDAEKASPFGRNLAASLDQLKSRLNDAKKDLVDVQQELNASGNKFGQFGSVIDGIGQKMGINANLTELLTSKTALMSAGIGASVAIIGKATEEWAKYNSELAKQDQITTVTTGVKGPGADRMTDQVRALVDTYGVDFREAINAANTLMTQFGKSGEEAMDLIRQGMQGMIQGDGPKLLSMIQQYAPSFRDAGIEASQLVAIIQNSEGGIFTDQNMNAIVMGIKNIRLMTKATSDALAQLGIDGQKMSKDLSDGTITIFDAMKQVVDRLQNVESGSQTAGEVMQQVFGRQGTAAGTNLAKAIATLNTNLEETKRQTGEVGQSYDALYEANVKLNQAIRDCFEYDGWEQMTNGIKAKLVTALADVLDVTVKIKDSWVGDVGRTIFDVMTDAALKASGPLGTVLSLLRNINSESGKGNGGNNGGIGYSDIDKTLQYIGNGANQQERETRYDKAIAQLRRKLDNIGKERRVNNADGSVSYKIDSQDVQDQKRATLERRISILEKQRNSVVNNPVHKNTNTTHIETPQGGNKGGKSGKTNITFADDSIMAQEKLVSDLTQKWKTASAAVRDDYAAQLDVAKRKLAEMQKDPVTAFQEQFSTTQESTDVASPAQKLIDRIRGDLAQTNLDEDMARFTQMLTDALKGGMDAIDLTEASADLYRRMLNGENIPQEVFDELQEYLQEHMPEISLTPKAGDSSRSDDENNPYLHKVKDKQTGEEKLQVKANELLGGMANGMNNVVQALNTMGVEIPAGLQSVIGGMQTISSILTGIMSVVTVIKALTAAGTLLPFANGGVVPTFTGGGIVPKFAGGGVVPKFAGGGVVPKFADGGVIAKAALGTVIPGNSYSGDNLRLPVVGGGMIGVNSGEVILNRAQAGVIAQELEGGAFSDIHMEAVIGAEDIMLVTNNRGSRTQKGEYVQSNNRRG